MNLMKVLVTGGRRFSCYEIVSDVLDQIVRSHPITELAHGACRGADLLAHRWAIENMIACRRYPVDEKLDGPWPAAGCRRNARMLDDFQPDLVVAFQGGSGTANCVNEATKRGIEIWKTRS